MLCDLDHVLIAVRDLEKATRQAVLLLGAGPSWRGEHPGAGTDNTLFRLDNTTIELLSPSGDGPTGRAVAAWLDARGEGLLGLAFGTEDADAARARLAEAGLEPGPVEKGMGRDTESGAWRTWRRVPIPLSRTRGVVIFAIERTSPDEILPPATPIGDPRAAVCALDHAVVQSPEPEATRALYGDALGLRLALDREFPQWGARLLFFRVGGVTVEVAARLADADDDAAPTPEFAVEGEQDRLWGLSYRVGNADAARARLADAGFDVSEVRTGRRPGTRVFSVRDGSLGIPTLMLEPPAD
jgi:catechol 2,3-dioxygenase-like lactoylglutathione lyase family enzyme